MISSDSFKDAEGNVDWKALKTARIINGEICYSCGSIIIREIGCKSLCVDCKALETDKDEVRHDSQIRCPKCKHIEDVVHLEDYEIYGEGEHSVWCSECDTEYEISTTVTYTFTSLELE